eukprot:25552-Eustigmatos_ZCMA.PRE.1
MKINCAVEIPEVGFSSKLTTDHELKPGGALGWSKAAKLDETKKTLIVVVRVNRVEAHYNRTTYRRTIF